MALPVLVSFGSALILVPLVRSFARWRGIVAEPREDRWHKSPTALLGGLAIWGATVIGVMAALPELRILWGILGGGTLLCAVGAADDLLHLKPSTKLVAQIGAAAIAISLGIQIRFFELPVLNVAVSFLWIVGVTNALNLLDNMDGLAAGVGMIAAVYLGWAYSGVDLGGSSTVAFALAASLAAFLVFNFNPASIFMGDSGSMFVGFALATLSLVRDEASGLLGFVAVPTLILLVPLLDTTLVSVTRVLSGRLPSEGGKDHTSHRLVVLGLSEKEAVLLLWGLSALAGASAVFTERYSYQLGLALIPFVILTFALVGVYLSRMSFVENEVSPEGDTLPQHVVRLTLELTYKRRILEVLADVLLATGCYYLAFGLRFGFTSISIEPFLPLIYESLPVIVALTILTFFWQGIYRNVWDYVSTGDLLQYVRACALTVLIGIVAVVILYRFEGYPRSIFPIYGLLLLVGLSATRVSFRLMDETLDRRRPGRGVLVIGAGSGGEIALREIQRNRSLGRQVVAFADDDPWKLGRRLHGRPVLGTTRELQQIWSKAPFEEVVISSGRIPDETVSRIREFCRQKDIELHFFQIKLVPDRRSRR